MGIFKNNPFFSVEEKEEKPTAKVPAVVATPAAGAFQNPGPTVINSFGQNNNNFGNNGAGVGIASNYAPVFPQGQPMQFAAGDGTVLPSPSQTMVSADVVSKFVGLLQQFIKDLPSKIINIGTSYRDFQTTLQSMMELGLPEDKLYLAVWKAIKSAHPEITTQVLLSCANQYLQNLESDKNTSLTKIDAQIQADSTNLGNDIQNLKNESDNLQKQIQDAQAKIAANSNTVLQKQQEINERAFKLTNNKNGYLNAFTQITNQIQTDIQKISTYIHD